MLETIFYGFPDQCWLRHQTYKDLLAPHVTEHIGVDHHETLPDKSNIDQFGTAYDLHAEDEEFDCALCTTVLEHLEEPELELKECHSVLKRGVAICSVPLIWHLHGEPRDVYRFSRKRIFLKKQDFKLLKSSHCPVFG